MEEVCALRQQAPVATAAAVLVAVPTVVPTVSEARMGLLEWLALCLDTFDGAGTLVQAAGWLRYLERQFEALMMSSQLRARYVAFQLRVRWASGGRESFQL